MTEIWKDIDGYEGRYQVSNLGNVKSLRYGGRDEVRNLVPKVNNKGYEWVELFKNGERRCLQIHRLVALAFIPNPEGYPIINHKDENTRNNCVENLEWCDQLYNVHYYIERHTVEHRERIQKLMNSFRKVYGGCHLKGKKHVRFGKYRPYKLTAKVAQIDQDGNVVKVWNSISQIRREENKSQWSISQCCDGKRKTAYGYKWQYVDAV